MALYTKIVFVSLIVLSFVACSGNSKPHEDNNAVQEIKDPELSPAQQYIQLAEQYEAVGDKDKAIENYVAALKLIYEAGMFDEGVMYSRKVLSLDSTNEYARYVHEQLLPSGRDSYLPGIDEDIDDDHDMELYFSDPYF